MAGPFEIPLNNQRELFGVFLAAHAIPDAIDIMHTGVGCKAKTQRQLVMHDRLREAQSKMVWSDISELHLITGSTERLRDMTVQTCRRRGAVGLVLLTTSTAMEMTGIDVPALLPELQAATGCPVLYLPTPSLAGGDQYSGYARAIQAVMALCPWDEAPAGPEVVNLVGYPFDRYERDHAMNLHELQRLLGELGLRLGASFLSGTPMQGLYAASQATRQLLLPHAASLHDWLGEATGRPCTPVELPLGTTATERFLEAAAASTGRPAGALRALLQRERRQIDPLLRVARSRLAGLRFAVLADTPTAAGLVALLQQDLGMIPVLVGLLDRTLGGAAAFERALAHSGGAAPESLAPLPDPSAREVAEALAALPPEHRPEILLMPDLWLPPESVAGLPRVEIGFPCNNKRALYAQPSMGFRGAVALAQRLLDAAGGVH